jgi:hypothetical protein
MRDELKPAADIVGLDHGHIGLWHQQLLQKARQAAGVCLEICGDSYKRENVQRLVRNKAIRQMLGAPERELALIDAPKGYEQWLFNLWGRRTSYFLSSLLTGLGRAAKANSDNGNNAELIRNLEKHGKLLDDEFNKPRWGLLTPQASLTSRGDLTNCLVTYLDPVLFTSLYVLNRYRTDERFLTEEAVQILWALIETEVAKASSRGHGRSGQVVDESTMWWGFVELVKHKQEQFQLGIHSGWQGVIDVCSNLIRTGGGSVRSPTNEETWYESTAEIYGETRTRLLVAKNCIELVYYLPADWLAKINNTLNPFVARQFRFVTTPTAGILDHICLLGLGLELSTITLQPIDKTQNDDNRLNERPHKVSQVSAETIRQRFDANEERFCVWFVEKGAFNTSPKRLVTKDELEHLRNERAGNKYDIFVDAGRGWILREKKKMMEAASELMPDDVKILTILLRQKNDPLDTNDFCEKVTGLPPGRGSKVSGEVGERFSVKMTRFRRRMEEYFRAAQFDVPKKHSGNGYYCTGSFSCCVIVPQEKEPNFVVKLLKV